SQGVSWPIARLRRGSCAARHTLQPPPASTYPIITLTGPSLPEIAGKRAVNPHIPYKKQPKTGRKRHALASGRYRTTRANESRSAQLPRLAIFVMEQVVGLGMIRNAFGSGIPIDSGSHFEG